MSETETTRDQLIAAAAQLIDQGGPAAVTLREVGRMAGVSHNAPYRHFDSKQALLAAVAGRELGRVRLAPDRAKRASSARDIMLDYVDWAMRYPARFKLTFGVWTIESPELTRIAQDARRSLVEAVTRDQKAQVLPSGDPEQLSALLLATAHGAVDQALAGHLAKEGKGRSSPADLVANLFRYLQITASSAAR